MSLFSVQLNFDKTNLPKSILNDISEIIAESFTQHIGNVNGSIVDNVSLMLHGNSGPVVFITVTTIVDLNYKRNENCSASIYKYLTSALDISEESIVVYFMEKVLSDVAIDGSLLLIN